MSLVLHVEDFPNLSSIMREIQRLDKWNTLRNLAAKDTDSIKSNGNGRRLRFNTILQVQMIKRIKNRERLTSLPTASAPQVVKRRDRIQSAPCPCIDPAVMEGDGRLTENAKKLSNEELALLYEDILKPLDFFSILHERRRQNEELL